MIYDLSEGFLDAWVCGYTERLRFLKEGEREDLGISFCFFLELIFEDCSSSQLSSNHNFFVFCFLSFDQ